MIVNVFDGNDKLAIKTSKHFNGQKIFLTISENPVQDMVDKIISLCKHRNSQISKLRIIGHADYTSKHVVHGLMSPTYVLKRRPSFHSKSLNSKNTDSSWVANQKIAKQLMNMHGGGIQVPYAKSASDSSMDAVSPLQRLTPYFTPSAVIDFMSCNIGYGPGGDKFLQSIADITKTTVRGATTYQTADGPKEAANIEGDYKVAFPGGKRPTKVDGNFEHASWHSVLAIALHELGGFFTHIRR